MEIISIEQWKEALSKAEQDDKKAQLEIAFILENGLVIDKKEIVIKDLQSAFNWIKRAFENGSKDAKIQYAHYLTDRNNPIGILDVETGMKLYEEEVKEGNDYAAYCLGLEHRNKQNFEKAFELYKQAQRNEEFYKDFTIGMCLYYGVGVEKDRLKAFNIFKSISLPNVTGYELDEANYMLGKIYLEGEVIEKNIEKARFHFELADKDNDHRSAQEILLIIGRNYRE